MTSPIQPLAVPERCFWELTRACDHRCLHCRCHGGTAAEGELGLDEALRVAAELVALGVRAVVLTGGEPTLYRGWERVARALADGGVAVRLFTGCRWRGEFSRGNHGPGKPDSLHPLIHPPYGDVAGRTGCRHV